MILVLAGCAAAPAAYSVGEAAGHYRKQNGPDVWAELDLMPDGTCTWWACRAVGFLRTTAIPGRWRIEGDRVFIEADPRRPAEVTLTTQLTLRRWGGHVYLVQADDVAWFDAHGPMDELCFAANGAPLVDPPSMDEGR
ncbi:MAG TPA: hypothetical protein VF384_10485 [Planctomycetota bacterium]